MSYLRKLVIYEYLMVVFLSAAGLNYRVIKSSFDCDASRCKNGLICLMWVFLFAIVEVIECVVKRLCSRHSSINRALDVNTLKKGFKHEIDLLSG